MKVGQEAQHQDGRIWTEEGSHLGDHRCIFLVYWLGPGETQVRLTSPTLSVEDRCGCRARLY